MLAEIHSSMLVNDMIFIAGIFAEESFGVVVGVNGKVKILELFRSKLVKLFEWGWAWFFAGQNKELYKISSYLRLGA